MNRWISFAIFITAVLAVYSLLNYYFIHKHRNILTLKTTPALLLRLVLITTILTPIATIIFSRYDQPAIAAITGFAGYSWLAFLGLFLGVHGVADISLFTAERCGVRASERFTRGVSITTLLLCISILVYGSFEAKGIQLEKVSIQTDKIATQKKIKIMQISDVHFSPLIGLSMAKKINEVANKHNPDLLVSTGDLLDPGILDRDQIVEILNNIKPKLGKLAVMGNHEFYSTVEYSEKFIAEAGFTLLRDRTIEIGDKLLIAGVDDPAIRRVKDAVPPPLYTFMSEKTKGRYTILLKHQPRIEDNSERFFDLQLSGHTHAGQIYPFYYFVKMLFPNMEGRFQLNDNATLYVNRGAGTWGPPFRFLAQPEITIIEIIGK